jgi:hypothetical protein
MLDEPLAQENGGGEIAVHERGACLHPGIVSSLPAEDHRAVRPHLATEIGRRVAQQPYQLIDFITTAEGGYFSSYQINQLAVDWRRGHGYFLNSDSNADVAGIRRFTLRTMEEDRQARMTDVTSLTPNNFPSTLFCGEDGHLYMTVGSGNSRPIIRVEPNALKEVARFGFTSTGLSNTTTRFVTTTWMGMVSAYGPSGRIDFVLTGSLFRDVGLPRSGSSRDIC